VGLSRESLCERHHSGIGTNLVLRHYFRRVRRTALVPLALQSPHFANRHDAGCFVVGADTVRGPAMNPRGELFHAR
jgi:hypothetical protein